MFYKLALASRGDGRLTRAISALKQAMKLNPSFHEAYYVLGLCLKDREELTAARVAFERASAISPAFIPAREELAELHRLQQTHARRNRAARRALCPRSGQARALDSRRPRVPARRQSRSRRDHAGTRSGKIQGTPRCLCRAWPGLADAAEDGGDPSDLRKALEALEPVAAQPTASSETLGMYGRALMLAGRHDEAEAMFRQASQRFPTDPEVLPHFASVAQRLGHLDDARQALVKYSVLVDDDRDEASHAARIADLSMQLNDAAAAVAWYRQSDALRTGDASLLARMADAQWRAGETEDALATLQRAIEKDENHPLVRSSRAAFRLDSASDRARRASHLREN